MNISHPIAQRRHGGFTLVELLVVMAIIAILAVTVFGLARRSMDKANATKSLSRLRECGGMLLADVSEKNGKLRYYYDNSGGSPCYEFRPYNIVRMALGMKTELDGGQGDLCETMHWNVTKLKPTTYSENCFAVNFTDIPTLNIKWATDTPPTGLRTLVMSSVNRPESYPFFVCASTSTGAEIYRVNEGGGEYVAMRIGGKGQGCFLDGSARELNATELKDAGFSRAYDNSTKPPKVKTL